MRLGKLCNHSVYCLNGGWDEDGNQVDQGKKAHTTRINQQNQVVQDTFINVMIVGIN